MMTSAAPLTDPLAAVRNVITGNLSASKTRGLGGIHKKPKPAAAAVSRPPDAGQAVQARPEQALGVFKRYFVHK